LIARAKIDYASNKEIKFIISLGSS